MKTINFAMKGFLVLLSFTFLSLSANAQQTKKTETLVVKTMIYCNHCKECESCGSKFERDLIFEKGIKLVVLDEKAMTITVTYSPKKTSPEKIRLAISKLGYDADEVKGDEKAYSRLDGCCKKS